MKTILTLLILIFPLYLMSAPDLTVTNLHLTSPNDGRNNPSFAWDANPNVSGYEISSDGGLNWIDVGNIISYTFAPLANNNYNVVVRAYAINSVAIPLFGGFGIFLLMALFGFVSMRKIRE